VGLLLVYYGFIVLLLSTSILRAYCGVFFC
jgi:hypothetical protein